MNKVIIAHRGNSEECQLENTIEAFDICSKLDVKSIELDIRYTIDKQIVVFHDRSISGYSVDEINYCMLNELGKKEDINIPLLEDVFKKYKDDFFYDIDIKSNVFEKSLVVLIKKYLSYNSYSVKSRYINVIGSINLLDKNINGGLVVGHTKYFFPIRDRFYLKKVKLLDIDFVSISYNLLSSKVIKRFRTYGKDVTVWNVAHSNEFKRSYKLGVAGIITNYPIKGNITIGGNQK